MVDFYHSLFLSYFSTILRLFQIYIILAGQTGSTSQNKLSMLPQIRKEVVIMSKKTRNRNTTKAQQTSTQQQNQNQAQQSTIQQNSPAQSQVSQTTPQESVKSLQATIEKVREKENDLIFGIKELSKEFTQQEFESALDSKKMTEIINEKAKLIVENTANLSVIEKREFLKVIIEMEARMLPQFDRYQRKIARFFFGTIEDILEPQITAEQTASQTSATNQNPQTSVKSQQVQQHQQESVSSLLDFAQEMIDKKEEFSGMLNMSINELRKSLGLAESTNAESVPNFELIISETFAESMDGDSEFIASLYDEATSIEKKRYAKAINSILKFCVENADNNFTRTAIPFFFEELYKITDKIAEEEESHTEKNPSKIVGFESYSDIWALVNIDSINKALAAFAAAIVREGEETASNNLTWTMRQLNVAKEKRVSFINKVIERGLISGRRANIIKAAITFN